MRLVIERTVIAVDDVELLAQAAAESPAWSDDLEDALLWLAEHGYTVVRDES